MMGFGKRGRRQIERVEPSDRRSNPRNRVLLSGKIVYGSGFTADCAIRDLSRSGACLLLPKDQVLPSDFYLIVVRAGSAHRARPTWTRYPLAGLEFESSHQLNHETPPHLLDLKHLWSALAPRGQGSAI
jgi:hypothetical protein